MTDTSKSTSNIDLSKARHLIDKDKLLDYAKQMYIESDTKLNGIDSDSHYITFQYYNGIRVGIYRIIKLIERQ